MTMKIEDYDYGACKIIVHGFYRRVVVFSVAGKVVIIMEYRREKMVESKTECHFERKNNGE